MHIIINGWFWGQEAAGMGQYLHHMLHYLPTYGRAYRFTVLVPEPSEHDDDAASLPENVHLQSVSLPKLPRNLAKLWWEQVTIPYLARQQQADQLWIPYWAAPYWQPCPTVVTIHDLIPLLLPLYRGGRLQRLYTNLVSHTAKRAHKIIAISHAGARDIVQYLQIPAERVHVVHHGPNQEGLAVPTVAELEVTRNKYNLPEKYFLYLGGFDARKNVLATVQAYVQYLEQGGDSEVKLVIAGKLPKVDRPFNPDPQKLVEKLNLAEQINFCGWVEDGDKPAIYALSMGYIFPSLYEGFGMMVLEAMAAGAAVVTSKG